MSTGKPRARPRDQGIFFGSENSPVAKLSHAAPMHNGRRALHCRHRTLLRRLYRTISRLSYDRLSALKPVFGLVRPLCRSKELHPPQCLHDLPPSAWWLADHHKIFCPWITAISWLSNPATTQLSDPVSANRPCHWRGRWHHQPRRPPLAKIRPGNPAPAMGPGTEAERNAISAVVLATPTTLLAAMVKRVGWGVLPKTTF
jgi:hypothetical protein